MVAIPKINGKVNSYISFATSNQAIAAAGTLILTTVTFNLLAPYVSRIPSIGRYAFALYFVISFIIYVLASMFASKIPSLRAALMGASLGVLINGLLTIPAFQSLKAQIESTLSR